jgi:hypothetical protein
MHLRFGSLSAESLRLARSNVSRSQLKAVGVWFWDSRLRLFIYESRNIRSYMIATPLLQQENRVDRSAKKAVAHQGKNDLAQGHVVDAPVERVQPCLVE